MPQTPLVPNSAQLCRVRCLDAGGALHPEDCEESGRAAAMPPGAQELLRNTPMQCVGGLQPVDPRGGGCRAATILLRRRQRAPAVAAAGRPPRYAENYVMENR